MERLRRNLGIANLAMAVILLLAIPPTKWMLAVWGLLAGVVTMLVLAIILFRRVLDIPRRPGHARRTLRAAFPPVAAGLSLVILGVQGADLEMRETTQQQDYWLLSAAMVLAVFTLMVSYDRSRPRPALGQNQE